MDDIQFKKNYSALIDPAYAAQAANASHAAQKAAGSGEKGVFAQMLRQTMEKSSARQTASAQITFSKHAIQRMGARQIEVSPQLMAKMDDAVGKAESKGVKEALILNGGTAFIVNIPSRTVVTTMNGGEMKDSVFTNIDGAVIL